MRRILREQRRDDNPIEPSEETSDFEREQVLTLDDPDDLSESSSDEKPRTTQPNKKTGRRDFALLNKNFCNYPIARDQRVMLRWRKGSKTGRWYTDLPGGEDDITISFPKNSNVRRCPSALDVNLLLLLLSEARKCDSNEVTFRSYSTILKKLGLRADVPNLRRVKEALEFWSDIEITFHEWYFSGRGGRSEPYREGRKGERRLSPPIRSIKRQGWRLGVVISEEWLELHQKYHHKIPLTLPSDAAAQNVVLCLLVSFTRTLPLEGGYYKTPPRRVLRFCRKLGLNHNCRRRTLRHALDAASNWFDDHGGGLVYKIEDKTIAFTVKQPTKQAPNEDQQHADESLDEPSGNEVKSIARIPRNRVERVKRTLSSRVERNRIDRAARHNEKFSTPGPKLVRGFAESGRPSTWWEWPDGRETEDRDGKMPIT